MIGQRDRIKPMLREKIERAERDTADNDELVLNIALSYGGRQEIIFAVKELVELAKRGLIEPSKIDEEIFSRYLYTKDSPDPDLLIRTSGEMRVSNFLLWQISYTDYLNECPYHTWHTRSADGQVSVHPGHPAALWLR